MVGFSDAARLAPSTHAPACGIRLERSPTPLQPRRTGILGTIRNALPSTASNGERLARRMQGNRQDRYNRQSRLGSLDTACRSVHKRPCVSPRLRARVPTVRGTIGGDARWRRDRGSQQFGGLLLQAAQLLRGVAGLASSHRSAAVVRLFRRLDLPRLCREPGRAEQPVAGDARLSAAGWPRCETLPRLPDSPRLRHGAAPMRLLVVGVVEAPRRSGPWPGGPPLCGSRSPGLRRSWISSQARLRAVLGSGSAAPRPAAADSSTGLGGTRPQGLGSFLLPVSASSTPLLMDVGQPDPGWPGHFGARVGQSPSMAAAKARSASAYRPARPNVCPRWLWHKARLCRYCTGTVGCRRPALAIRSW